MNEWRILLPGTPLFLCVLACMMLVQAAGDTLITMVAWALLLLLLLLPSAEPWTFIPCLDL